MSVGFKETSIVQIDIPTTIPEELPFVLDDCSLAFSLGFRNKIMWFLLREKKDQYRKCRIPKKSGGIRIIHAPEIMMKLLLKRILVKYLAPLQEQLGPHVTAYRKNFSAQDAVKQHIPPCGICDAGAPAGTPKKHECPRRGLFVHMDLKDFFTTTRRAWIREFFQNQGYNFDVAGLLSNLMTVTDFPNPLYEELKYLIRNEGKKISDFPNLQCEELRRIVEKNIAATDPPNPMHEELKCIIEEGRWFPKVFTGVPQGSPAASAICNLIADWRFDQTLLRYLAKRNQWDNLSGHSKWVYTRYSDDLSFTCGRTFTARETAQFIDDVREIIDTSGYRINEKKTRISHGYYGKYLLGTVCNQKPNIRETEYRQLRALVHNCLVMGFDTQYQRAGKEDEESLIMYLTGKINYVGQVSSGKGKKLRGVFDVAFQSWKDEKKTREKEEGAPA